MFRKLPILAALILFLIVITYCVTDSIRIFREYESRPVPREATLIVMEGDEIVEKIPLTGKFVFYVRENRIVYTDTTRPEVWTAEKTELRMLGAAHQKAVLEAEKN